MSDDLEQSLHALPERDVDPWRRERIRARAHAALDTPAWLHSLERVYATFVEPTVIYAGSIVFLVWAFVAATSLHAAG